jgi:tetratricopeptide (TPR) repeat protein
VDIPLPNLSGGVHPVRIGVALTSEAMKRGIRPKGLSWLVFLFMLASFLSFTSIFCQTSNDAIRQYQLGQLDEAKRILLKQLQEDSGNPEVFFYLGKVEETGNLSREYLESMIKCTPDWIESEQANLLICQYEFCKGMNVSTIELTRGFKKSYPQSENLPEILWIRGCAFLAMNQPDSALLQFEDILRLFPDSDWAQWALLGRGDCLFVAENYDRAASEYHRVVDDYQYSEAFPFAISGLANCYNRLKDPEITLLYYNLLKEKYPLSLEYDKNPVEEMKLAKKIRDETIAERLVGVRYAVQLGVFGIEENALKLRSQFENRGFTVSIKNKIIEGKRYSVVQVGSFVSYEEALKLKKKLESQTNESYRVVIK